MSPSDHSSVELKTLWFIEGVPLWVKQLALVSITSLGLALIIGFVNTRYTNGTLSVHDEQLQIITEKKTTQLEFDEIKEVAFVAGSLGGNSFKIEFKTKSNEVIRLKLPDYLVADELTDSLKHLARRDVKILSDSTDPYWPES
jgi:hypothetical protein